MHIKLQLGLETINKTKYFATIIIATNRRIIKVISNINSLHKGLAKKSQIEQSLTGFKLFYKNNLKQRKHSILIQ